MNKNIILTGVPRSGTSLLTKLISQQADSLCFSEPTWIKEIRFAGQTCEQFAQALYGKIEAIRDDIRKGNPVEITVKKGTNSLPDNYYIRNKKSIDNLKETISVNIEHDENLCIVVKANTIFTACLASILTYDWSVFAVVRNPLYVLMSWRSLNIPVSQGKIKIGELYSQYLRDAVLEQDLLIRQAKILDWFYKKYYQLDCSSIKYEQLIAEPEKNLKKIIKVTNNSFNLKSSNNASRYQSEEKTRIINTLKNECEYIQKFYDITNSKMNSTTMD